MPRKINRHPGQSSLSMRCTQETTSTNKANRSRGNGLILCLLNHHSNAGIVWDEELPGRLRCKPLSSIERHIVQRHQRAVRQEQVVKHATPNNHIVRLLDHARQWTEGGRLRQITHWEKSLIPTNCIIRRRSVDSLLDITSVEVVVWSLTSQLGYTSSVKLTAASDGNPNSSHKNGQKSLR